MKFSIGQKVIVWGDGGDGMYDGCIMYIVGWNKQYNSYRLSEKPQGGSPRGYIPENELISFAEWQQICIAHTAKKTRDYYDMCANWFMSSPMNQWPDELMATCRNVTREIGVCGEVLYSTVQAWIGLGHNHVYTYAEVNAYHQR